MFPEILFTLFFKYYTGDKFQILVILRAIYHVQKSVEQR